MSVPASPSGSRASHEAASCTASSPKASIPNAEARFRPAQFRLATRHDSGPLLRLVDGWSDGTFGLDKRSRWDGRRGYVVSHLRTGYAIFGVTGSLKITQSITKILHRARWDFDQAEQANASPDCKKVALEARTAFDVPVSSSSDFDPATYIDTEASAIEARRAATENTGAVHESAVPKADVQ